LVVPYKGETLYIDHILQNRDFMDRFRILTVAGELDVDGDEEIKVESPDGNSFLSVPASRLKAHSGNSKGAFDLSRAKLSFDKMEKRLIEIREGKYSAYRKALYRLHDEVNGETVPVLACTLQAASHGEKNGFLDELYGRMEDHGNSDLVGRAQLNKWYNGKHVVPFDWRNLRAISSLSDKFPALGRLEQFAQDAVDFEAQLKSGRDYRTFSVDENLYFAWIAYNTIRSYLGRKAKEGFSSSDPRPSNGKKNGERKVDMDSIKEFIEGWYGESLGDGNYSTPILKVRKLPPDKKGSNVQPVDSGLRLPSHDSAPLKEKSTEEVVHDVVLLELFK